MSRWSNTGKYAGTGAAIGSTFGPWGTAIGAGAGALYGFLTGGGGQQPTPPDPNAAMYKYDPEFIRKMIEAGKMNLRNEAALARQSSDTGILSQALRGNMLTSSLPGEKRAYANAEIDRNMLAAMAQLMAKGAEMEQYGQASAYDRYSRAYENYLNRLASGDGGDDEWLQWMGQMATDDSMWWNKPPKGQQNG